MKRAIAALSFLAALALWACHLGPEEGEETFALTADSAWAECDTVTVILLDEDGDIVDTLFHDSLASLEQLRRIDAGKYDGGKAGVRITGAKDGGVCFDQTRIIDGEDGKVVVDTVSDPRADVVSLALDPDSAILVMDSPGLILVSKVTPDYASREVSWSVEPPGIVSLELAEEDGRPAVRARPARVGKAKVVATSRKNPSVSASALLQVRANSGDIPQLDRDSLLLYVGGEPESLSVTLPSALADEALEWSSDDEGIAEVGEDGVVTPVKEGRTTIKVSLEPSGRELTARVEVRRDVPELTVQSKTGAPVDVPIVFSVRSTQQYGHLALFKWDLDGDGSWDDSLAGPWYGEIVDLPALMKAYAEEGSPRPKFLVRDSEGNEAAAEVSLDIGNQAPEILSITRDTLISIKDSVPFAAEVQDVDGKVAMVGWDYDGDGALDDSSAHSDSTVEARGGYRYGEAGEYRARLVVRDASGKSRADTVVVTVVLDPPVADAGDDITVQVGSRVTISAKGTDKFGSIARREIRIGDGSFLSLSSQDTSILVTEEGSFPVVVRVTDDDDQSDEDTLMVTVIEGSKSNADLAVLKLSKGALEPGFKPVTLLYSAQVDHADSQVTVEAVPADPAAKVAVNGKSLGSGGTSEALTLKVGTSLNVFQVVVTAQDGTQKIYAVSMTRLPSAEARLASLETSGFTLKPEFSPDGSIFADTVAAEVDEIGLKPFPMESNAAITINDTAFSGSEARTFKLQAGVNVIKIGVTAQDGETRRTYTVNVARRARLILSRKLAGADPEILDTVEILPGVPDSLKAPSATGFAFRAWNVIEGAAEIADSGKAATTVVLRSGEVRVQADYDVRTYVIRTKAGPGGSFSVDSALVEHGEDFQATVTPLVTHRILAVKVDGKEIKLDVGPGITTPQDISLKSVTADLTLEAEFRRVYSLKASVNGDGTVSPETVMADSGSTQRFTFRAGTGRFLAELTDNGNAVLPGVKGNVNDSAVYTLESVGEEHSLAGTYKVRQHTLTVVGIDVCIRRPVVCQPGDLTCVIGNLCLITKEQPDSVSMVVEYGTTWIISTAAKNANDIAFTGWSGGPPSATTNPDTVVVTSNVKYTANYGVIVIPCIPRCIDIPIDGPILNPVLPATADDPEELGAGEPPVGMNVKTRPPEDAN